MAGTIVVDRLESDATTDSLLAWPFAGGGTQVYGTITGCYRV